jgi:PmbA protein
MRTTADMRGFVREACAMLARQRDLAGFDVYASSSEHRVARINYTSDIPARGVEEFKSLDADGFAIRIAMAHDPHATGNAAIAGDMTIGAVREALERARRAVIVDPHFPGLPRGPKRLRTIPASAEKSRLMGAKDEILAAAAWRIVGGALAAFRARMKLAMPRPGLVIGGDLSLIRDRIAIGGSNFDDVRNDESARFASSVTALVEALNAKGSATAMGVTLEELNRAGARLGREALIRALALRHGERPRHGTFRVVMGPQPIAEILNYMVVPSLTASAFQAANSAYQGRFGELVMDERISLADDPGAPAGSIHRTITCEGLPAERTELVRHGRLCGLLANTYDAHRLLADERRAEKLGAGAPAEPAFPPHSAYRMGESSARRFDGHPGAAATNLLMTAGAGVSDAELIRAVGDGIYVGRVWYTYPINGQRAGDFTCTISGDSYVIRGGRLAAPLAPNHFRINANISEIFSNPIGIARRPRPAMVWGSPEAYIVPPVAIDKLALSAIASAESD